MMASATSSIQIGDGAPGLRPFDARRDLAEVADLIELGFNDTLDESGRRYIQQMRSAARSYQSFGWLGMVGPYSSTPMSGYVWEEDGRVVGNLSLIAYLVRFRRFYLIANVVVHPDYRNRGIGRALTARAVAHARESGAPEAWLHVRPDNPGAVRLYESLGFIERARRTTWQAQGAVPQPVLPSGVNIRLRHGSDWSVQQTWLEANYPSALAWQLPYNSRSLRPGLQGWLFQTFNQILVEQWALRWEKKLMAVTAIQSDEGRNKLLWLSAPADVDDFALTALLVHARNSLNPEQTLTLDYPADQSSASLDQAGFKRLNTLIWMSINTSSN